MVLLAWLMLLTTTVIWDVNKDALYENMAVSAGQLYPPPEDFPQNMERYLHASVAVIIFFYSGLWSVKISFLLFFRRLGQNVKGQRYLWWAVLAVTLATYFCCVGTINYKCQASSFEYLQSEPVYASLPLCPLTDRV